MNAEGKVLGYFDVQSVFTNVPIIEIIDMIGEIIYNNLISLKLPLFAVCKSTRLGTSDI